MKLDLKQNNDYSRTLNIELSWNDIKDDYYKEYKKAKSITEKRLYLETMEKVLPGVEKIIIPDKDSGNMLNLLNLNPNQVKGGQK